MKTSFSAIAMVLIALLVTTANSLAQENHVHSDDEKLKKEEERTESCHKHESDMNHDDHYYQSSAEFASLEESPNQKHEHTEEQHETDIVLSPSQIATAGIIVEAILPRNIGYEVYAPAELKANGYTSFLISPRVDSIVMQRHISLGEHVAQDQPLVTLFSELVAEAQADYRIDKAEWKRVRSLPISTVSEKEKSEAQTRYVAARANLKAFGLSEKAISDLSKDNSSALGEYTLYAIKPGLVLNDDFQQGQRVEAGEALLTLVDEQDLWVEARLSPSAKLSIPQGSPARISVMGESYRASVIQEAHTIDQTTRTRVVRLLVNNDAHTLHSGMFADSYFQFETSEPIMAVPESALVRNPDSHWIVFVQEEPGVFEGVKVETGRTLGQYREVSGLEAGTQVVTVGAFFVASEQARSGFDPHNH